MENKKEIIKDIIISVLIVIIVTLILIILSYKKLSIRKVVGEIENYNFSPEMQNVLSSSAEQNDVENVVITYSIDSSTLKKYENTNEYNKGKNNPFQMESNSLTNVINQETNSTVNNSSNTFFYGSNNLK